MSEGGVEIDEPSAGVHRIRIVNPDRHGALSPHVVEGLLAALGEVRDGARCLILASCGTTFSAGYDIRAVGRPPNPELAARTVGPERMAVWDAIVGQPLPVVAALNGPALGGGLELALACDLRIAADVAVLGAPAGRLGLVYSPGGLERLSAELAPATAAELFLAAGTLDARRAHELGLVSRVVVADELEAESVALAEGIAALAPGSVRAHTAALRARRAAAPPLPPAARDALAQAREHALRSRDFAEGIEAFAEQRAARFRGD